MHTYEEIQARLSAIATELETATGEALTALETEANTLLEERRQLEAEASRRQQIRDAVAAGTVETTTMERTAPTGAPTPAEQRSNPTTDSCPIPGVTMAEVRSFAGYIRGVVPQMRAGEQNFDLGNNGALLPVSIARRVIDTVRDICPIFAGAEIYRVKGTLKIPTYGKADGDHDITVGYADEFTELVADAGAFGSIDLSGYLIGALTLVGRSLINNSDIDLTNFVIRKMAEKIASFIESELLTSDGASGHCTGALTTTNTIKAGSATAITADNLIDLQARVKQVFQGKACWTMNPLTWTFVKKLKDKNDRYLVQNDVTKEFPYMLLGKPVYLSDSMPVIGTGNKPVLYGDYSGLSVNMREDMSIEVLREKYATMHAIGLVAWMEMDSKVTDPQKLATLETSAS